MCAITSSFSKSTLSDLYKLNSYRGELSYSLSSFGYDKYDTWLNLLLQDNGKMPDYLIDKALIEIGEPFSDMGNYFIAHSQAPTTNTENIHPAVYAGSMLWHNGIIKQKMLPPGVWDTHWLLQQVIDYGWSVLSRVDGTFACIMYNNGKLYFFRNEISPLFIDREMNLSSTKFAGSQAVTPNIVWEMSLLDRSFRAVAEFSTMENPYYIPE